MVSTIWVNGTGDGFEAVKQIREAVFVSEQGRDESCVADAHDPIAANLLVIDEDGAFAATGRLYPSADGWRIGRIAVLANRRGKRLGDLVIRLLCARALDTVPDADISVHACEAAAPLYEKFGFRPEAAPFAEEGAVVIPMRVKAAEFDWHRPCHGGVR